MNFSYDVSFYCKLLYIGRKNEEIMKYEVTEFFGGFLAIFYK